MKGTQKTNVICKKCLVFCIFLIYYDLKSQYISDYFIYLLNLLNHSSMSGFLYSLDLIFSDFYFVRNDIKLGVRCTHFPYSNVSRTDINSLSYLQIHYNA